jgi:hypothetical protein
MKKAYITGGSQGIGRAFASQFCKTHDIVIVSRSKEALDLVASDLKPNTIHSIEVLPLDLTNWEDLKTLYQKIEYDVDLDVLVNNAGFGTFGDFADCPIEKEWEEVDLNIKALMGLTHAALRNFRRKGSGSIIQVASLAAFLPAPRSATYAATKAFVKSFSESIHEEAKEYGVTIQTLCPGLTHSEFHERAGIDKKKYPNFMWQSAEEVVSTSIRALETGDAVCVTGAVNQGAKLISDFMPRDWLRRGSNFFMKQ